MRNLLLAAIVSVLCLTGLFRPQLALYGYIWYSLMRPDVLAWAYGGGYPYSLMLAIATLAGSLVHLPRRVPLIFKNPFTTGLLLLMVPVLLSTVFALQPNLALAELGTFGRMIVMVLMIPILVETTGELRMLMLVMAGSIGLLGAKFGIWGLLHGGVRFAQGYGGMMSDNNALALGFAMSVPLCWYARTLVSPVWAKMSFLGMAFGSVAAVVMTFSRGAAVALAAGLMVILLRSRHKVVLLIGLAVLTLPAVFLLGDRYLDRISTLTDATQETSAYSRIVMARIALRIWLDHPVLGVGFGMTNQQALVTQYGGDTTRSGAGKVIHNTYLQMLTDSGLLGLVPYCALLFGALWWLQRSIRKTRDKPELQAYPLALQSSLVTFVVGATFLSRVEFDLYYILLMATAAWYDIQRPAPPSPAVAPHQAVPAQRASV